jgi:hypothetical protein
MLNWLVPVRWALIALAGAVISGFLLGYGCAKYNSNDEKDTRSIAANLCVGANK